jgi:Ca2+-binding EF-hand superfamily protein
LSGHPSGFVQSYITVDLELLAKIKDFFLDIKARIGESFISFDEAIVMLREELHYPEDRALHFVKRFDHNKDGRLSASEFSQFKTKIAETKVQLVPKFKEFDRDGNGYITLEEASTILQSPPFNFPPGKVVVLLKRFDRDGNGKLDIEEFAGFYAETKATNEDIAMCFNQLDKDGNGVLSPEEVIAVIQEKMGFDENMARYLVQMFDQNQDGSLDKGEFVQLWSTMFGQGQ